MMILAIELEISLVYLSLLYMYMGVPAYLFNGGLVARVYGVQI